MATDLIRWVETVRTSWRNFWENFRFQTVSQKLDELQRLEARLPELKRKADESDPDDYHLRRPYEACYRAISQLRRDLCIDSDEDERRVVEFLRNKDYAALSGWFLKRNGLLPS